MIDFYALKEQIHFRALIWYLASLIVMCTGSLVAASYYPGGFDWEYTVASALASQRHNPVGGAWFAGALALGIFLIWPYVSTLKTSLHEMFPRTASFAIGALRVGMTTGVLLGLERLLLTDFSKLIYKGHEVLAVITYLSLYLGVLTLLFQTMFRQKIYLIPVLLIATPLFAIGVTQLWLYFAQYDIGWVNTKWRERGISIWLSFAFWQWVGIVFLWLGLGLLSFAGSKR